ncbi:hypothetical protein [Haloplanus halobius]|uniref:hypothetical protein n=1 Tax=Haloplanus halobius TaxID=2934938 RepID=UPI00200C876C|nr:hypothetical protein [Haloplanus sp. XH21]
MSEPAETPQPAVSSTAQFELAYRYDEPSNPSTLTVFTPETERCTTEWLTVDRPTAVSLDAVR